MADNDRLQDPGAGTGLLLEEKKPETKKPPLYRVVILNDDYTPMEFVVEVLEYFFGLNREKATQIMLAIHTQGKAAVGIFPKDIAETKSYLVNQYARDNEHPLLSDVEPASQGDD